MKHDYSGLRKIKKLLKAEANGKPPKKGISAKLLVKMFDCQQAERDQSQGQIR